jgi:CBS domain-containing protein
MSRWKVADVMTTDVASVRESAPYREIVDVLATRGVSAVPVVDASNRVVGVVSEADLLHKVEFKGEPIAASLFERRRRRMARDKAGGESAGELMSTPAVTVPGRTPVVEAARLMEAERVKRLPVVDDLGRLVGIVSRRDLLSVFLQPDAATRDEIIDQVLKRVLWVDPHDVSVEVHDGVVILAGELERRSLVPIAVRLTREVDGVVDVVDHLTYRNDDLDRRTRVAPQ